MKAKLEKYKKNLQNEQTRVADQEKIIRNFSRIQEAFEKERKQHQEEKKKAINDAAEGEAKLKAMLERLDRTNPS